MEPLVERAVNLDASPDDVWRTITESDELATWLGSEAELDARPGGHGRFVDDDGVTRRAVVDEVRPGERLVLRWWPEDDGPAGASIVTFVVAPIRGGARLVITERPAATASAGLQAAAASARTAWQWRLDLLLLRVAAVARV